MPDGRYVELSIADNGSGMPEEIAERAFEPFFTTKPLGKGTGLGLSQVYAAVRQSGGAVRIESAVGTGTVVRLLLRTTAPVPDAVDPHARQERPHGATATILVVDDDPDVRNFLVESLATLGYRAIVKEDGASALAMFDDINPDVMIVDFAMPGMNGAELARKARERRPDLPIILASGYSETVAVKAALGEHSRVLQKPFNVHDLQSALHELLAGSNSGWSVLR